MTFSRRRFLGSLGAAGALSTLSLVPNFLRVAAQAQTNGRAGRIVINDKGAVRIHTYVAPDMAAAVTSHIIETPNQLVIVDTQLVQFAAAEVRAYADSLSKPIERVIVSHAHPDHFLGTNQFTDVAVVSTPGVAEGTQAYLDAGGLEQIAGAVGADQVPSVVNVPEGSLELGDTTIDGIDMTFEIVTDAESPEQVNIRLPEFGVIVLQDLLYTNVHFFPGLNRPNWIAILEDLQTTTEGYDTLLAGHGVPTTRGELDDAIRYLNFVEATVAEAASADDITAALLAEYPNHELTSILSFWAQFFQPQ